MLGGVPQEPAANTVPAGQLQVEPFQVSPAGHDAEIEADAFAVPQLFETVATQLVLPATAADSEAEPPAAGDRLLDDELAPLQFRTTELPEPLVLHETVWLEPTV